VEKVKVELSRDELVIIEMALSIYITYINRELNYEYGTKRLAEVEPVLKKLETGTCYGI